jgi:hypothetical protein
MTGALVPYQHLGTGFTLRLPDRWERVENQGGVALIAAEPDRDPWFRANAVVTIEQMPTPTDLAGWHENSMTLLRQMLDEFLLLDVEDLEIGGLPARRTLAHHRSDARQIIHSVTFEQWALLSGDRLGYTLTASVATLEYDELADGFTEMAHAFRPDPGYTP